VDTLRELHFSPDALVGHQFNVCLCLIKNERKKIRDSRVESSFSITNVYRTSVKGEDKKPKLKRDILKNHLTFCSARECAKKEEEKKEREAIK
jgi:hypothetical protein